MRKTRSAWSRLCTVGFAACLGAAPLAPHAASSREQAIETHKPAPDIGASIQSELASVVSITTMRPRRAVDDPAPNDALDAGSLLVPEVRASAIASPRGLASGFVIASNGYILTSAHAVWGAESVIVHLADRRALDAKVIGLDRLSDVALLKVDATDLPAAEIGKSSRVRVGDWVFAIGSPFGLERSVTAGIVSAHPRFFSDLAGVPFMQTDVAINRGSSGGPLFDIHGQVIGINTMIVSESGRFSGVSFTLPIDVAMKVADELRTNGYVARARLGARVQDMTPELAKAFGRIDDLGALITRVDAGSPAEDAGLHAGDIILGAAQRAEMSSAEIQQYVSAATPGSTVLLKVWRRGEVVERAVKVVQVPAESVPTRPARLETDSPRLGLRLAGLSLAERRLAKVKGGLRVVACEGPAEQAGVRPDDVIVAINDAPVDQVEEFDALLAAVPRGRPPALLVVRGGARAYVAVPVVAESGR